MSREAAAALNRTRKLGAGPVSPKVVEEHFVREGEIYEVHIAGRIIEATPEHPFFVKDKGWIPVEDLKIGDTLCTPEGESQQVENIIDTGRTETVYNLRVADYHTYFVAPKDLSFAVWVHNDYRAFTKRINNIKHPVTDEIIPVTANSRGLAQPHALNVKLRDTIGGDILWRKRFQTRSGLPLHDRLRAIRKSPIENRILGHTERAAAAELRDLIDSGTLKRGMHVDMVGINPMCSNCYDDLATLVDENGITIRYRFMDVDNITQTAKIGY